MPRSVPNPELKCALVKLSTSPSLRLAAGKVRLGGVKVATVGKTGAANRPKCISGWIRRFYPDFVSETIETGGHF